MSEQKGRSYEKQFEIAAPLEAVWKALTEGEEMSRWFCKEATCEPGVGGQQRKDWGGGMVGTSKITVWEPGSHLRTEAVRADLAGPDETVASVPYATDWYLEHEGGVTRVRMVASGFGEGPKWDSEYDGTYHGWDQFHKTLRHYLEHHAGQASVNVVIYAMLPVPREEAWERLKSREGLVSEGSLDNLAVGAPFRFVTSQGDLFEGEVRSFAPAKTFSAMVENLNKAILNLELGKMPGYGHFLYISLNTWGLPKAEVDALESRLKAVVHGLFPQSKSEPAAACAGSGSETIEPATV